MWQPHAGDVTARLVQAAPTSVRAVDYRGNTPLHLSARGRSRTVVDKTISLLESCPAAVLWRNHTEGLNPLELAKASGYRSGRVASLLERWAREILFARRSASAPTPLASCEQRLAWAACQHHRLGGGGGSGSALCCAAFRFLSVDIVEMVERLLPDREAMGRTISARLEKEGFVPASPLVSQVQAVYSAVVQHNGIRTQ